MTTVYVSASYTACVDARVELPEGKAWEDVESWYVKWDTLRLKFKGNDQWSEIEMNSDAEDGIDWKRPASVEVLAVDEDGCPDFDRILGEYN